LVWSRERTQTSPGGLGAPARHRDKRDGARHLRQITAAPVAGGRRQNGFLPSRPLNLTLVIEQASQPAGRGASTPPKRRSRPALTNQRWSLGRTALPVVHASSDTELSPSNVCGCRPYSYSQLSQPQGV
jgi:hypothetical protein